MAKRTRRKKRGRASAQTSAPSRPKRDWAQIETASYFYPLLALCGLLMGIWLFDANLSLSGDNAQFINLGRAMASGHGLSETLGDTPTPHTKYPFGFPLLLALTDILFPGSLIALKGLVVLLFAASIPLIYKLIRIYADPILALAVCLLCLLSKPLLEFSHQVMSEIPFLPFALLALILLHRANEKPDLKNLGFAILGIMAAYYIRSAGIALVGTGILFFAIQKKWREAGIIAAGCLVLALPWSMRNAALGGGDYVGQLLSVDPYRPEKGLLSFAGLTDRLLTNAQIYGLKIIPQVFIPSHVEAPSVLLGLIFGGLTLYFVTIGLKRRSLLSVYLLCYLGVHLLWPQVWSDIRFLIPAIPVLFYAVLSTITEVAQRAVQKSTVSPRTVLILFFLMPFASNLYAANQYAQTIGKFPPNWGNYFKAGEWIRDNTEASVKIACRKPFLINAIANRKTSGYVWEAPDAVIADFEKNDIGIVIIDQIGFSSTPQYLIPAVQAYQDRFDVLHIVRNPDTYVLKFKKQGLGAGD